MPSGRFIIITTALTLLVDLVITELWWDVSDRVFALLYTFLIATAGVLIVDWMRNGSDGHN